MGEAGWSQVGLQLSYFRLPKRSPACDEIPVENSRELSGPYSLRRPIPLHCYCFIFLPAVAAYPGKELWASFFCQLSYQVLLLALNMKMEK